MAEITKSWWYVSVANPHAPKGQQRMGVVILQANDMADANNEAVVVVINSMSPETRHCLDTRVYPYEPVVPELANRLIPPDEVYKLDIGTAI